MDDFDNLPDRLEAGRLDETLLAEAYEHVPAQERARLKTAQTLVQAVYAECPALIETHTVSPAAGYDIRVRRRPAPWALAVAGAALPPCRLSAALTCARLAGVDALGVVFPAGTDLPPACYTVLDLCGVEHAFALSAEDTLALLRQLNGRTPRGRLLLLEADTALAGPATALATELALPRWDTRTAVPAMLIDETLRGCWMDADLAPDFFLETQIGIRSLQD